MGRPWRPGGSGGGSSLTRQLPAERQLQQGLRLVSPAAAHAS